MKKILIVTILLILIILASKSYLPAAESLQYKLAAFYQRLYEENLLLPVLKAKQLKKENELLKQELDGLRFAYLNSLNKDAYIKELESALGIEKKKVILAKVKYLETPFLEKILLLNENLLQEKVQDKELYAFYSGFVLGAVKGNYVDLFSAPKNRVVAFWKKDDKKAKLVLEGLGAGRFRFEANKEFDIKIGDLIYYHDYPIAQVVKKESDEKSPYNMFYASLPFNLDIIERLNLHEL